MTTPRTTKEMAQKKVSRPLFQRLEICKQKYNIGTVGIFFTAEATRRHQKQTRDDLLMALSF
jgi:hypothetical protein